MNYIKDQKDLLGKITSELEDIKSFNRDTQAWQKKVKYQSEI